MKVTGWKRYALSALERMAPIVPDVMYLHIKYYLRMGKWLNLKNPQTFSEKLQWLKLYGRRPIDTILSDKYAVKDYITKEIGSQYVIPLLGVWDSFDDIDFDELPNQFVLKCSHDSGGIIICKDKRLFDVEKARAKLNRSLKTDYYVYSRERAYKKIPRRIIAEQYMEDCDSSELKDYKFFCFDGEVKYFKIDFGRFTEHHANYYGPHGEFLNLTETSYPPKIDANIHLPINLNRMVELAGMLSKGIPFVRVDFYEVSGQVFFGEFTFSPAGGMTPYEPDVWDYKIGSWIRLPEKKQKY